jgi:thiol-disulfide isomerase/thioredoxin
VVGEKLPEIVLACLGGDQPVSVRAAVSGNPHVINLWASWCRPCRAEAPILGQVSDEMSGTVGFLGIDYGERSGADGISFARAAGWTYPQLEDPDARTRAGWGVTGLPVTLLVAGDGTVVKRLDGAWASADQLRAAIRTDLERS